MIRHWAPGLLILAALSVLPAVASANAKPDGHGYVRLSNERTLTTWAHPAAHRAQIRTSHSATAPRFARTHTLTEDGFPEVYIVLRSWKDSDGHTWLKIRVPMRPNGQRGWVRDSALGPLYRVRTHLVIDRSDLEARLYRRGEEVWSAPIGVGAPATPTPPGDFWIREKFEVTSPGSLYGPDAFGTSDYSVLTDWPGGGVIGIHGTNEPGLIPGRPSHGCIRVRNPDIRELWSLLPVGTPVTVR
jgi:L,D-transpeptidase-like protein